MVFIVRLEANMKHMIVAVLLIFTAMSGASFAANSKQDGVPITVFRKAAYKINPGDILNIVTWKEEDFTIEQILVRIDGKISFPLLNDIQAAGLTPLMLKDVIEKGLKNYVTNPVVTVAVADPQSQRFYILGEVQKTGEYPIIKNLTVMQAFAIAGGFTEWASKNEIILVRYVGGQRKVYKIDYKDMAKGKNLEQDLLLQADDTIIVP
jgi:polysaccharide export outer membrane protein